MMDIRVHSVIIPFMLSLVHILGLKHIGEVAGRSLYPCVLQVDAYVIVWLRSPNDPSEAPYLYAHISDVFSIHFFDIICILPVKPCRQRRHFSPQMRVNRFVFLNLPILKPWGTSWRNGFASFPFTCGLRHPAS